MANPVFRVTYPNQIDFTLEMTMTLEKWLVLKAALDYSNGTDWTGPVGALRSSIQDMVLQARTTFSPKHEVET